VLVWGENIYKEHSVVRELCVRAPYPGRFVALPCPAASSAMADGLFSQYENEYCSKSTDISGKIQGLSALTAGKLVISACATLDLP